MNRYQLTWTVCVICLGVVAGQVLGLDAYVRLDVVTPDPNDPNAVPGNAPLVVAAGGNTIGYTITAMVYTDPNDGSCDGNYVLGLATAYVTLNTNFGDANLVQAATSINGTLDPAGTPDLGCLGLVFGDDVTDIGGSQRLLGETPSPSALANGTRVTLATGMLTAPSQEGIYHVWVTAQEVRTLDANLAQVPRSQTPNEVIAGQGFYIVVGTHDYYTLSLTIPTHFLGNPYGQVEVSPNLPSYPAGMEVTLTALPDQGKHLDLWRHYDVNAPFDGNDANCWEDSNYFTKDDVNNPITVVMDRNRTIWAVFTCGSSLMPMLGVAGVLGVVRLMRRRR